MNAVIDNGYHTTKVYQQLAISKSFSFRSKYQESIPIKYHNTNHVTLDKPYIVGDGEEEIDINLNKSNYFLHYLTTITALGLLGSGNYNIGGLTAQACVCQNLNIIQSSIYSDNLGTLVLMNKIKKTLNSTFNLNLQDYEMENIIKLGLPNHPNSLSIISSICTSHVDQIIKSLKLTGWNLESLNVLLTGGGSLLLEPYLSKVLPIYKMSNNPVNDNVWGLWEVSKHVFMR